MKALREDTFVRKRAGERRRRSSGVIIFSLVFLSSALLVLSRIDHPVVRNARIQFADLAAPALEAVARIRFATGIVAATRGGSTTDREHEQGCKEAHRRAVYDGHTARR